VARAGVLTGADPAGRCHLDGGPSRSPDVARPGRLIPPAVAPGSATGRDSGSYALR
jgi:hypothetical protein